MFGLFSSKTDSHVKVVDKVWMTNRAKLNACEKMMQTNPACLFAVWFEESGQELKALLKADHHAVIFARDLGTDTIDGRLLIFYEHHPLLTVEQEVFKRLGLSEAPVMSSLEEPFFMQFGGERLGEVMRNLGMKDDDMLGHAMITRSIANAQARIEKKSKSNLPARSQQEWFSLNA